MAIDPTTLTRAATDAGKIIEAGWLSLRAMAIPQDASAIQIEESRNCFFAGAHHLLASIMVVLDPDDEPTERDFARLTAIQAELDAFIAEYKRRHGMPELGGER